MLPGFDRLETVYRDVIQPRMLALPMYNAALQVEASGFGLRGEHCSGVLITPWCMNLVLLPVDGDTWTELAPGSRVEVVFPAGTYLMTLSLPADTQPHLVLTLFTTVLAVPDQDTARRVADEVLQRLYQKSDAPEYDGVDPLHAQLAREETHAPLSRRDLLRGEWRSRDSHSRNHGS